MPTTINGIGTHYYGKKNSRVYQGVCDACGHHGEMTDYETGYFFVLLFIPVIPLGKRQIIGDCSACRQHRLMPVHEWNRISEESVEQGLEELAATPEDSSKAIELLGTLTVFNRRDEALDLAVATQRSHQDNVDVQIGLGAWYEGQGMPMEGNQCFQRAIELNPEYEPCKRIAAIDFIEAGEPLRAAERLETLRPPSQNYDPALFLMLASAFQAQEQHEAALGEFQAVIEHQPEIGNDNEIRKLVKRSEKACGRAQSILPKKGLFG